MRLKSATAVARIPRLVLVLWLFALAFTAAPSFLRVRAVAGAGGLVLPRNDVLDETMLPTAAARVLQPAAPVWVPLSDELLQQANLDLPEVRLPRVAASVAPEEPVEAASADPPVEENAPPEAAPARGADEKWIDVNLAEQRIVAYLGDVVLRTAMISSGVARHPTVVGEFHVYLKLYAQRMKGGSRETYDDYDLPGVPNVMYFFEDYAIHGAYWHHNFGHPMSHGCVNLPLDDAQWFYEWAPVGTLVLVHN